MGSRQRVEGITWPQVLAWRLSRQLLQPRKAASAPEVARSLCGIQAQVGSAAELAVAVRQRSPRPGQVDRALWKDRSLVKTWAMRGTLHLLPADVAGSYVATLSRLRPWEAKAWERYHGISAAEVDRVCEAIDTVLDSEPRTREELSTEITEHVRSRKVAEKLRSGWSELLKPAAFQGLLCQGPPRDRSVTFVSPSAWIAGWHMPDPNDAGPDLVRWFLSAHGPATVQHFADWWGRQRPSAVRPWFERLGDELVIVDVEGTDAFLPAGHVGALRRRKPTDVVRLLPNFDQFVLASGRSDEAIVPAKHKARISRQAGWISKVVLMGGRVAGVWEFADDGTGIEVDLFEPVPIAAMRGEARHLAQALGRDLGLTSARAG